MMRPKCELITRLSSQTPCEFMNCYTVYCTYGKENFMLFDTEIDI